MIGRVDNSGRSLLEVDLRPSAGAAGSVTDVWVDTGFTGDLVLPKSVIDELTLTKSGSVDAVLADGSQVELNTYTCFLEWFGAERRIEVIANDGDYPLLGVGLLISLELHIDYHKRRMTLRPAS